MTTADTQRTLNNLKYQLKMTKGGDCWSPKHATWGVVFDILVEHLDALAKEDGEPTDEELLENGREFMAEWEREFGPIPDEVIADVERRWPLIWPREALRQLSTVADLARHASSTTGNISDLKSELRALADRIDVLVRRAT